MEPSSPLRPRTPPSKERASPGSQEEITAVVSSEDWHFSPLIIVILGASGDLAAKKTYPSLFSLYTSGLLPKQFKIIGYARSPKTIESFREHVGKYLSDDGNGGVDKQRFLENCDYINGKSYGDEDAFKVVNTSIQTFSLVANKLFYFAIPASTFAVSATTIKTTIMGEGWLRIILEKPFGHDLESCRELTESLAQSYDEENLYRIDHYLGKEMVQNLMTLRFSNLYFSRLWDSQSIAAVLLTFKEPFGTDGRGGYFDRYGIVRDIIQNHLMQVLCLIAMEPPLKVDGSSSDQIRTNKVNVLKAIEAISIEDVVLGQYEGYRDDPTVPDNSTTSTFCALKLHINTPRWEGVPFILKAGKALDERKAEIRIQFKDAPAASFMFDTPVPRNELVIRLQPREAIYIKTNVKTPGFSSQPVQSELEVDYTTRFGASDSKNNPDAYTRLILEVLRGRSAGFVRKDELEEAWRIFTPLLHQIERERQMPIIYQQGTRGPEHDVKVEEWGYLRNSEYVYYNGAVVPKSKI